MMKSTVLLKLDARDPDLSKIREVARASREGKVVGFPTETVYGIGLPISNPKAHEILVQIKKREPEKPFSIHIGGTEALDFLRVKRNPVFKFLMRHFWPGPVTFIVQNEAGEKIGLRYPRNRLATAFFNAVGEPFIATSANMSGAPSPHTADEVMSQLDGQIDYLIDGGPTEMAKDSTVLDVSGPEPVILRAGADADSVERALDRVRRGKFPRKKILFVCTGNSCRSPMAAGWLSSELRRRGLGEQIEVSSCGIGARTGASPTTEAILTMKNREVDISGHRSRPCTREDAADADIIFAMSTEHCVFLTSLMPGIKDKVKLLNIPDPIGMGIMVYEEVMSNIEKKLKENWNEIIS